MIKVINQISLNDFVGCERTNYILDFIKQRGLTSYFERLLSEQYPNGISADELDEYFHYYVDSELEEVVGEFWTDLL